MCKRFITDNTSTLCFALIKKTTTQNKLRSASLSQALSYISFKFVEYFKRFEEVEYRLFVTDGGSLVVLSGLLRILVEIKHYSK